MMLPCQEHICVFALEMDVLFIPTDRETEGGEPSSLLWAHFYQPR